MGALDLAEWDLYLFSTYWGLLGLETEPGTSAADLNGQLFIAVYIEMISIYILFFIDTVRHYYGFYYYYNFCKNSIQRSHHKSVDTLKNVNWTQEFAVELCWTCKKWTHSATCWTYNVITVFVTKYCLLRGIQSWYNRPGI